MGALERLKNAANALMRPTVNTNDDELLKWLGVDTTNKKIISEVTYFTCLKLLSETMGKLPIKYYEYSGGGKIRAEPSDAARILMSRPNAYMTPTTLWSTVEANCQHYGNGYAYIHRMYTGKGKFGGEYKTLGIYPMKSTDVTVLMDDKGIFKDQGKLYYQYNDPKTGEMYVFKSEDIMHFKTWLSFDGIMGESVRNILKFTINGALESQKFMNNLYEQGLTASMAMQYTGELNDERIKKLQNKYNKYLTGSKNAGKIVPLPVGLSLTPLKMELTDAQFFELKKFSALQIAGAFGIKPNQINNYEKSSYSNSEMQQLTFLVDTMAYRLKMYEEEINYKYLSIEEEKENRFYKINEKAILRTDSKTQMSILREGVDSGIYTRNEARGHLGEAPIEGGDVLTANGNVIPVKDAGKQYDQGKGGKGDGED